MSRDSSRNDSPSGRVPAALSRALVPRMARRVLARDLRGEGQRVGAGIGGRARGQPERHRLLARHHAPGERQLLRHVDADEARQHLQAGHVGQQPPADLEHRELGVGRDDADVGAERDLQPTPERGPRHRGDDGHGQLGPGIGRLLRQVGDAAREPVGEAPGHRQQRDGVVAEVVVGGRVVGGAATAAPGHGLEAAEVEPGAEAPALAREHDRPDARDRQPPGRPPRRAAANIGGSMALSLSGRLSRTSATPSWTVTVTRSAMGSVCTIGLRRAGSARGATEVGGGGGMLVVSAPCSTAPTPPTAARPCARSPPWRWRCSRVVVATPTTTAVRHRGPPGRPDRGQRQARAPHRPAARPGARGRRGLRAGPCRLRPGHRPARRRRPCARGRGAAPGDARGPRAPAWRSPSSATPASPAAHPATSRGSARRLRALAIEAYTGVGGDDTEAAAVSNYDLGALTRAETKTSLRQEVTQDSAAQLGTQLRILGRADARLSRNRARLRRHPARPSTPPPGRATTPLRPSSPTPRERAVAKADLLEARAISDVRGTNLPLVALDAYRHAADLANLTSPGCGISWTLLAGIGAIESRPGHLLRGLARRPGSRVRSPSTARCSTAPTATSTSPTPTAGRSTARPKGTGRSARCSSSPAPGGRWRPTATATGPPTPRTSTTPRPPRPTTCAVRARASTPRAAAPGRSAATTTAPST